MGNKQTCKSTKMLPKAKEDHPDLMKRTEMQPKAKENQELMKNIQRSKSTEMQPKSKEAQELMYERIRLVWVYKSYGLSMNVLRVICEYLLSPRSLVHLRNDQIRYFDVNQKKWKPLCYLCTDLSKHYYLCYALTMCNASTFVICGGLKQKSAAHIIEDGIVSALPNLRHGRYSHGAVHISPCSKVYLFGGAYTSSINSSESLDLHSKSWQEVAPMHKRRANINPLLHGRLVYIAGGDIECSIESYDWRTNYFGLLTMIDAPPITYFSSVITGDSLLCISSSCNYRVSLQTGQILKRYVHERISISNTASMVRLGNVVLFADEHKCFSYSLEDGMKVEIINDIKEIN